MQGVSYSKKITALKMFYRLYYEAAISQLGSERYKYLIESVFTFYNKLVQ